MDEIPGDIPSRMMLGLALMKSDFSFTADHADSENKPTPAQYALRPGDCGFLLKTDSGVDDGLTVVKILDATEQQWANQFPDFGDRLRNGFVLCQWHNTSDPEGDIGWISLSKIVPLEDEEQFVTVLEAVREKGDDFDTDDYPFLDRRYRIVLAEQLAQDNEGQAVICEVCQSVQVVVEIRHTQHVRASAAWTKDEESGEQRLVKGSTDSDKCTLSGRMECLDCGWNRKVSPKEFAGPLSNHEDDMGMDNHPPEDGWSNAGE